MLTVVFLAVALLIVPAGPSVASKSKRPKDQLILVSLSAKKLQFFENSSLIAEYSVRVGKPQTPTPLGEGYIYEKRYKQIFRYIDPGPKQGQVIYDAECTVGLIKVDYSVMRGLAIYVNGDDRFNIHSTTCSETMGQAISNGCIGMSTSDMLKLYPRVRVGARIRIVP